MVRFGWIAFSKSARGAVGRTGSASKNDTLDAESAARSVLAGVATAIPKVADGAAEIVRQTKVVRDTAIKARSAAMITLNEGFDPGVPDERGIGRRLGRKQRAFLDPFGGGPTPGAGATMWLAFR